MQRIIQDHMHLIAWMASSLAFGTQGISISSMRCFPLEGKECLLHIESMNSSTLCHEPRTVTHITVFGFRVGLRIGSLDSDALLLPAAKFLSPFTIMRLGHSFNGRTLVSRVSHGTSRRWTLHHPLGCNQHAVLMRQIVPTGCCHER